MFLKPRSVADRPEVKSNKIKRKEPCRFCGDASGLLISAVAFWDIAKTSLVICPVCRLAQLDPMLSDKTMQAGVYAYYLMQKAHESQKSHLKNCARNFRKGYAFAAALKRRASPQKILELGPGDGYFLRGLQHVFPDAEIYAWDMVPEVAETMRTLHGFTPISGALETLAKKHRFDLIIARDVIEHIAEVGDALQQITALISAGGHFHFITPTGHEDLWKFYARIFYPAGPTAELLLNHVNYFDGAGLDTFLQGTGLKQIEYYAYDFSSWKMGIGWQIKEKLTAQAEGLSAKKMIAELQSASAASLTGLPVPKRIGFWRALWFRYKAWRPFRINPRFNFGHEIHGLYRKN